MNDDIHAACRARQGDLPPEYSMGGINAFSHGCKTVGFTPGYAVCLHKLAAFERDDGKLGSYPECEKAIRNRDCPAIAMRKEEQVAGKALYFIDRAILREEMDKHFKSQIPERTPAKTASKFVAAKTTAPAPAPKSDERLMTPIEGDGYAAAINAAIAEANVAQPVKEEPKVAAPSPSDQPKRPSLLEMARMKMGNQTKEQP